MFAVKFRNGAYYLEPKGTAGARAPAAMDSSVCPGLPGNQAPAAGHAISEVTSLTLASFFTRDEVDRRLAQLRDVVSVVEVHPQRQQSIIRVYNYPLNWA